MKKLSVEEKAHFYNEALIRAKNHRDNDSLTFEQYETIDIIFPELRESEDECVKRTLYEYFKECKNNGDGDETWYGLSYDKILYWLEKQGTSYTKRDVDDAYLKGVTNTKDEIEKQYEANYQIRKDIATFIFNYRGNIKDRAKWMNYLGIKVSLVEKQGE